MYPNILWEMLGIKPEYIHPPTSAKHLNISLGVSVPHILVKTSSIKYESVWLHTFDCNVQLQI
jgi:hypothetical protein